jgi:hypothetical protein
LTLIFIGWYFASSRFFPFAYHPIPVLVGEAILMILWLSTFAVLADRAALWHDVFQFDAYYDPAPASFDVSSLFSELATATSTQTRTHTSTTTLAIRDVTGHLVRKAAGPVASPAPTAAAQLPVHLNYIIKRDVFKNYKRIYDLLAVSSALGAIEWYVIRF